MLRKVAGTRRLLVEGPTTRWVPPGPIAYSRTAQ
jgi:hypothetical protein